MWVMTLLSPWGDSHVSSHVSSRCTEARLVITRRTSHIIIYADRWTLASERTSAIPTLSIKDMLINKDDMTVNELKGFLQSHLGDRSSTELFQELMCIKQSDHKTPQQFLYRVLGLKQKILFAARQADSDRKYSAATVQDVFLHTVYQGLSHECKDIRSKLKPLLADSNVTDDAILRHVMKVTSDETERLRQLGLLTRTKPSTVSSAQVHSESGSDEGGRTEAAAKKAKMTRSDN